MNIASSITLFLSMVVLALIPGPGVMVVTARSASSGLSHGISTTVGVVAGDYIFITLSLLGLATLSSVLGDFFIVIKYLGAAYFRWLVVALFLSSQKT